MLKLEKLVDYRIELLGCLYDCQRGEEITISKTLSKADDRKIERAVELGIVKKIGGVLASNNAELDKAKKEIVLLNAQLEEAKKESNEYIAEIIADIHKLSKNKLEAKYPLQKQG